MHVKGLIRAWVKGAIAGAVVSAGCVSNPSSDTPVCEAVLSLARSQTRGTETTVEYYSINNPDVIFGVACTHNDDPRLKTFCARLIGNTSMEFMNAYAYDVNACVERHGRVLRLDTSEESSGLRLHPQSLELMEGRLGLTHLYLRRTDRGFALTLRR